MQHLSIDGEDSANFKHMLSIIHIKHFSISEKASEHEQAFLLNKLAKFKIKMLVCINQMLMLGILVYKILKETDILLQSIALQQKFFQGQFLQILIV